MAYDYRIGVAICTPIPTKQLPDGRIVREKVAVEWHRARSSLSFPTNYNSIEIMIDGEEVGDARNLAVHHLMTHNPRPKYLLFIDYDVIIPPDAGQKLIYRAEHFPDFDVFAGVYCAKTKPEEPLIYKGDGQGPFWDWTVGDLLFDITGIHMGLTLIRSSLFDRIAWDDPNKPLFLTQNGFTIKDGGLSKFRGTEDLFFCKRIREEANAKILVDTSVLAAHMDYNLMMEFGLPLDSMPVKRAQWLRFGKPEDTDKQKKALDIGAGSLRREWAGYTTFTTDLRADTKPDYVMDSRWLNLPDNSFDLIASSHHLEHLGRWEQERIWAECFRVCKPGGLIEHIVPSAEWAAGKIIEGDGMEHALNVLYGAQEQHGYARELNTHFFAYTPAIAKSLAESAGFVDVQIEDYKSRPELGYNLVIRGRKPEPVIPPAAAIAAVAKPAAGLLRSLWGWVCVWFGKSAVVKVETPAEEIASNTSISSSMMSSLMSSAYVTLAKISQTSNDAQLYRRVHGTNSDGIGYAYYPVEDKCQP